MSFPDPSRPVPYVAGAQQLPPQPPQQPEQPAPFQQPVVKGSPVTVVVVILAVVLLIVGGAAAYAIFGSGGTPKQEGAMNQVIRDGDLEFMVTNASCNNSRVGTELLGRTAQGQFCLISITVKNQGDSSRSFSAGNCKARSTTGTKYDLDGGATALASNTGVRVDVNPGNTAESTLVFDIPTSAKLASVELHQSGYSDGVLVDLHW